MGPDSDLNPFHVFVCIGDLSRVKSYLKSGLYKVDEVNQHGKRAIHYAIEYNRFEILTYLVGQERANVDACSASVAPLATALTYRRKEMVKYLLGKNANPQIFVRFKFNLVHPSHHDGTKVEVLAEEWRMMTPLHIAALRGDVEMIEWFLGSCGINAPDEKRYTPLHYAMRTCLAAVQCLIEAGADMNATTKYGHSPFLLLMNRKPNYQFKEETLDIVKWLEKHGSEAHVRERKCGLIPLVMAAGFGNFELVEYLADLDVETRGPGLAQAVTYSQLKVAEYLLKIGTDPNSRCIGGDRPLHFAATHGNMECVQLLLQYGADVNARRDDGVTPLHLAVKGMHLAVCKYLLEYGADPNLWDKARWTVFLRAVQLRIEDQDHTQRMDEIIGLMLDHGADVHDCLPDGENALCLAEGSKD